MDCDSQRVTPGRLTAFAAGFGVFLLVLFGSETGFVFILDHANLLFHEAGHPLLGFFSPRLQPYGGTLGQLAFPLILFAAFWRKGQPLGMAATAIWFFENWLNIARYVADARALRLPLVGGGDHDWNTILFRWDLLQHDTQIAEALTILAWVGIAGVWVWLLCRAWLDRRSAHVPNFAPIEEL